jgi:hypothetical protein
MQRHRSAGAPTACLMCTQAGHIGWCAAHAATFTIAPQLISRTQHSHAVPCRRAGVDPKLPSTCWRFNDQQMLHEDRLTY